MTDDDLDEVLVEFLAESHENLNQLESDLVALEASPDSAPLLSSIFRTIHTIKGTSGFLTFARLEAVTHVGETLLSKLRDHELSLTDVRIDALLRMVDSVRDLLGAIEATGAEGETEIDAIVALLAAVTLEPESAAAHAEVEATESPEPTAPEVPASQTFGISLETDDGGPAPVVEEQTLEEESAATLVAAAAPTPSEAVASSTGIALVGVRPARSDGEPARAAIEEARERDFAEAEAEAQVDAHADSDADADSDAYSDADADAHETAASALVERASEPHEDDRALLENKAQGSGNIVQLLAPTNRSGADSGPPAEASRGVVDRTIRVDVDALDALMSLVGELVLNRNQIVQYAGRLDDADLLRASQRLDLVASELQGAVMKTRMQPMDRVLSKLPRVVRDLSTQCGKQVQLFLEGGETELDKTLLEAVKDPITHLLRNSLDHGIETPDERVARGKPATGRLALAAFHEGGQVVVEVTDDGGGIDPAKVGARALERGLVTADELARMTSQQVRELIFRPGFSTAEVVTNVSGRGVGMDVVRTNIEKIGGTVDVTSVPGQGTTIRLKIPLTLAIIPALIVGQAGERYAIPQSSLLELVRMEGDGGSRIVERVAHAPVLRLRGKLLPLVDLGGVLDGTDNLGAEELNVVVLQSDDSPFGLVVDSIFDTQEIVVKPLGRQVKDVPVFAGATIMGDGEVALILDVTGIAERAGASEISATIASDEVVPLVHHDDELTSLLVVQAGPERLVMPLDAVSRIESVPCDEVERGGDCEVVQYRGELLPLVWVSHGFQLRSSAERLLANDAESMLQVVVTSHEGRSIGLVVDEIVDIATERVDPQVIHPKPGVIGTLVVQDRVSDLLDLDAMVETITRRSTGAVANVA